MHSRQAASRPSTSPTSERADALTATAFVTHGLRLGVGRAVLSVGPDRMPPELLARARWLEQEAERLERRLRRAASAHISTRAHDALTEIVELADALFDQLEALTPADPGR